MLDDNVVMSRAVACRGHDLDTVAHRHVPVRRARPDADGLLASSRPAPRVGAGHVHLSTGTPRSVRRETGSAETWLTTSLVFACLTTAPRPARAGQRASAASQAAASTYAPRRTRRRKPARTRRARSRSECPASISSDRKHDGSDQGAPGFRSRPRGLSRESASALASSRDLWMTARAGESPEPERVTGVTAATACMGSCRFAGVATADKRRDPRSSRGSLRQPDLSRGRRWRRRGRRRRGPGGRRRRRRRPRGRR